MDNFLQHGDRLRHTLSADALSGAPLVVGTGLLGIALVDGKNGVTINTAMEGVYSLPKVSAAAIVAGKQVLWDDSAGEVDDDAAVPAAGDFLCGYAWEDAGAGVLVVDVKINRLAPTVT
ncbi:hypothetical protein LCGC14_2645250 [marine sediment metagenome]|uniref:DUF2190 family protein n=1 Tax=marine sediment metagenome TaxID=412755 RepID=A0A0F9C6V5_9ZZZZ